MRELEKPKEELLVVKEKSECEENEVENDELVELDVVDVLLVPEEKLLLVKETSECEENDEVMELDVVDVRLVVEMPEEKPELKTPLLFVELEIVDVRLVLEMPEEKLPLELMPQRALHTGKGSVQPGPAAQVLRLFTMTQQ